MTHETKAGIIVTCSFLCLTGVVIAKRAWETTPKVAQTNVGSDGKVLEAPDPNPGPMAQAKNAPKLQVPPATNEIVLAGGQGSDAGKASDNKAAPIKPKGDPFGQTPLIPGVPEKAKETPAPNVPILATQEHKPEPTPDTKTAATSVKETQPTTPVIPDTSPAAAPKATNGAKEIVAGEPDKQAKTAIVSGQDPPKTPNVEMPPVPNASKPSTPLAVPVLGNADKGTAPSGALAGAAAGAAAGTAAMNQGGTGSSPVIPAIGETQTAPVSRPTTAQEPMPPAPTAPEPRNAVVGTTGRDDANMGASRLTGGSENSGAGSKPELATSGPTNPPISNQGTSPIGEVAPSNPNRNFDIPAAASNTSRPPYGAPATAVTQPMTAPVPASKPQVEATDEFYYPWYAGDSFDKISRKYYGTEKYAKALVEYNKKHPGGSPALKQGKAAPEPSELVYGPVSPLVLQRDFAPLIMDQPAYVPAMQQAGSNTTPGNPLAEGVVQGREKQYRVPATGEMFLTIARNTLTDENRWPEIYRLNPRFDPKDIVPGGSILRMPSDARINATDAP